VTARILIADDEPAIALSLEFLLRNSGFQTMTAQDGNEALRLAGEFQPDLVVLDLMLPGLSGIDVSRQLRADAAQTRPKVLMLTARGAASDVARGKSAGADAYMVKPFSTKDLLGQVHRLLAREDSLNAG
jgi:DNA-binding response OmpR family regulator